MTGCSISLELPRPGRGDLQPRALQALQQLDRGVGIQVRLVERVAHLGEHLLHPRGAARRPGADRAARSRIASCRRARHGRPANRISAAIRAPTLSAASSRARRPGWALPSTAARCRSELGDRIVVGRRRLEVEEGVGAAAPARGGAAHPSVGAVPWRARMPVAEADVRRMRWHSRRSTQRSTRTPAASSGGYQRAVGSRPSGDARVPASRTQSTSSVGEDRARPAAAPSSVELDRAHAIRSPGAGRRARVQSGQPSWARRGLETPLRGSSPAAQARGRVRTRSRRGRRGASR